MLVYWILFIIPAVFVLTSTKLDRNINFIALLLLFLFLLLLIGTRHKVGGDWDSYYFHYIETLGISLSNALEGSKTDTGYIFINWAAGKLDLGIYGVNFISGLFFVVGLFAFSVRMPMPWLTLVVFIPFLVVVVSMGYTRQSIAIGFEFFAINAINNSKNIKFIFLLFIGSMFHKTLILVSVLLLFLKGNFFTIKKIFFIFIFILSLTFFLIDYYQGFIKHYIENQKSSSGGGIRVFLNVLPAIVYLIYYKEWNKVFCCREVWTIFSVVSIFSAVLLLFSSATADRLAMYLIPIQGYVWSHFPLLIKDKLLRTVFIIAIVFFYAAVLFVWLNFGRYSDYWLPYQSFLLI